jgi:hypothetical protein
LEESAINVLGFLYPVFTTLPYMCLGEDMWGKLVLLCKEFPWPLARRLVKCQQLFLLLGILLFSLWKTAWFSWLCPLLTCPNGRCLT